MTQTGEDRARRTFYSLRAGMIVMVAMLIGSVALQIARTDCWLYSISAYYYTPVRAMFVGALCAIGISLVAYQGRTDTENVLLDYSGFLAFIVAFVPTEFEDRCTAEKTDTSAAVTNSVVPLLVAGLVVTIWACFRWWSVNGGSKPDPKAKVTLFVVLIITVVLVGAGTYLFFADRDFFEANAHGIAAYSLFGGILLVVVTNVVRRAATVELFKIGYFWVALIMVLTVAAFLVAYLAFDVKGAVFAVEFAMIVEFAWFWILQTREFKHEQVAAQAQ
ncbi:MAG TPA: hypothetical protein VF821_21425 [Lentzea sp.]